jgi:hypothetical protein
MKTIDLKNWEEFGGALAEIWSARDELTTKRGVGLIHTLFRGVGSENWRLETTLDRSIVAKTGEGVVDLPSYYHFAERALAPIETFTDRQWPDLPRYPDFVNILKEYDTLDASFFFPNQVPLYRFLVYLRHHGYPSPLLDWSASPYIAAFFAFNEIGRDAQWVCVYAIVRDSISSSSGWTPKITELGPNVRAHRRHMIQQSSYTICMNWDDSHKFCSHDDALATDGSLGLEGKSVRIRIPASERFTALGSLDLMNINAYSLFSTEDTLMQTLARRSGLFGRP